MTEQEHKERIVEWALEQVKKSVNELDDAVDTYYNLLLEIRVDLNIKQAIVDLKAELEDFRKRICGE